MRAPIDMTAPSPPELFLHAVHRVVSARASWILLLMLRCALVQHNFAETFAEFVYTGAEIDREVQKYREFANACT